MTAGAAPAFTVTARDAAGVVQASHLGFGAELAGPTINVSFGDAGVFAQVPLSCTLGLCATTGAAMTVTQSGWYMLNIETARPGGLWATYYSSAFASVVGASLPVSTALQAQVAPCTLNPIPLTLHPTP